MISKSCFNNLNQNSFKQNFKNTIIYWQSNDELLGIIHGNIRENQKKVGRELGCTWQHGWNKITNKYNTRVILHFSFDKTLWITQCTYQWHSRQKHGNFF
jgi:hypothetical protein